MDTNVVIIEGRITKNAEMKSAGNNTLTTFSIANNQNYKKDGQWVENSYFFDCEIWRTFGETMRQYLNKGQKITVVGQLIQNRWTDSEGKNRSTEKIRVKDLSIQFEKKSTPPSATPQQEEQSPYDNQNEIAF